MKWFCLLIALGIGRAGDVAHPDLAEIKTVYLLPMSNALDQFLAIRLTRGGVLLVVTDPKKADAILSDHIGASLEDKMNSLFGESPDKEKEKDKGAYGAAPMAGTPRSKGAIFLVDRRTRNILWSDYVRPKSAQADELNHVADKIAGQLEKDKKGK